MTLRQWYAGQALAGSDWSEFSASPGEGDAGARKRAQNVARQCFFIADAMIEEADKQ
jgi:hypothetical protein